MAIRWLSRSYEQPYCCRNKKDQLSKLIDRALKGEHIVVTRRGQPVVELKPVQPPLRRMTAADLEWLRSHRIRRISKKDAATLVREMRDEEWK